MVNRKAISLFLAIAFGLAWILFVLPIPFGPPGSPVRQQVTLICWSLAMWAPGLGAILATRYAAGEPLRSLNLGRLGEKRAYLWAWLLPPFLVLLAGLFTLLLGAGQLDREFSLIRGAIPEIEGQTIPVGLIVAGQVVAALTIGPLFNTLFALGEELGWRGFLLPRLMHLGQWKAILISGAIWGIWHAPAILQGHNFPTMPGPGVFLMVVFSALLGAFFSWLYLRTRSPWAPALAHGSINASAGLPLLFLTNVNPAIGGTIVSLIGWIPLALFTGWLIWTRRLPVIGGRLEEGRIEDGKGGIVSRETS
jgi:uncharacterized protein